MFTSLYVKTTLALENFKKDQRGVTAIEYAIIGAAIAGIVGTAFASDGAIATNLTTAIGKIGTALSGTPATP